MNPPIPDWNDPYVIRWLDREIDKRIEQSKEREDAKAMKERNELLLLVLGIVLCLSISAVLWVLY